MRPGRGSLWPKRSSWTGRSWDRKGLACAPPDTPWRAHSQPRGMEGSCCHGTRTTRTGKTQDTRTGHRRQGTPGQGGGSEAASQVPEAPSPSGPRFTTHKCEKKRIKISRRQQWSATQAQGPVAHKALREAGPDAWETERSHRRQQAVSARLPQSGQRAGGHLPATQAAGPTQSAGVCRLGRLSVSNVSVSPTGCRECSQ